MKNDLASKVDYAYLGNESKDLMVKTEWSLTKFKESQLGINSEITREFQNLKDQSMILKDDLLFKHKHS